MRVLDDALHGMAFPAKVACVQRHANRYPSSRRPVRAREPESGEPLPKEELVNRSLSEHHPTIQRPHGIYESIQMPRVELGHRTPGEEH